MLLCVYGCVSVPYEPLIIAQRNHNEFEIKVLPCDAHKHPVQSIFPDGCEHILEAEGFTLLVWNMFKGRKEGWKKDFLWLSQKSDVLVLQEAFLKEDLRRLLQTQSYQWDINVAFTHNDVKFGVLTATGVCPGFVCSLRDYEPLIGIPKTVLVTGYSLAKTNQTLIVANCHLINFSLNTSRYRAQLQRLERFLAMHEGPLVVAGDFNSWSEQRLSVMRAFANRLGIRNVVFDIDERRTVFGHKVDNLYYRGLDLIDAVVVPVETSDHNPILATFRLTDKEKVKDK
jgi:endonuclease/exonuclease/phosphatase (EEP) superfamily protein YafD